MKTMLKRLTSLLLVFAMLLSFAAVVSADTTYIARAYAENVAVTAEKGSTKNVYVPVYLKKNTTDYIVSAQLEFRTDADAPIQITDVLDEKDGIFAGAYMGQNQSISGVGNASWAEPSRGLRNELFVWVQVTVSADAVPGTYALHVSYLPTAEGTDTGVLGTSTVLGTTDRINSHNSSVVEYIDGSITVLPAGAELPTLIMTKTSFPRPTKVQNTQSYDLAQYVKLVNADGSVTNAENLRVDGGKVVGGQLRLSYQDKGSTTVTVSAGGLSKQITLDITSGSPVPTSVKFVNKLEKSYTAPAPGEASPKTIDLDIQAYDQYDDVMQNAATRAILKVNGEEPGGNSPVYLSGNQICIRSDLANDVNCTVTPVAEGLAQGGMTHSFTVKSSLPKATELTIEGGTTELQVPVEGQTSTATFTASLKDQYGQAFALESPQWSVSLEGVEDGQLTNYVTSSTTENGAQITVTLLPKAKELLADKEQVQLTLTITANELTSERKTVQIQKATPRATSLGRYYGSEYQSGLVATNHTDLSLGGGRGIAVPGIDEKMDLWKMEPIYLFDQYGQVIMQDGKAVYAPAKDLTVTLWHADNNGVPGTEVSSEAYEIIPQDDGSVVIAITNKLDAAGNLLFTAGDYQLKIAYNDLTLTVGKYRFDYNSVYKATVTADKETVALPY